MASTDKTPKLGLNQWAAGDRVLRTDFNEDNGKIEAGIEGTKALVEANKAAIAAAALAASNAAVKMAWVYYTGNKDNVTVTGTTRECNFGFRPKLVIVSRARQGDGVDIITKDLIFRFTGGNGGPTAYLLSQLPAYEITDTGIIVKDPEANEMHRHCYCLAFA